MKLQQREEYENELPSLKADGDEIGEDPFLLFKRWYSDAEAHNPHEANVMVVASVNAQGMPSQRAVLLREVENETFVFYTNYLSEKGDELKKNPHACLYFYWRAQHRQIRINGLANKVSEEKSNAYFSSRPLESQVGSALSKQSRLLENHAQFYETVQNTIETLKQKGENTYPRPAYWGGYAVKAARFEFWQGRTNRLHERLIYEKTAAESSGWKRYNLFP